MNLDVLFKCSLKAYGLVKIIRSVSKFSKDKSVRYL